MPKVSIIVPIYNAEKYLKRCLDSIVNQTFKDMEIILVNDGSKDSSIYICNSYKEKDPRIKIIDKNNEGVSKARNSGLAYAYGTYISFIDADDYIEPEMIESLYESMNTHRSDICFCNYINHRNGAQECVQADIDKVITGRDEIKNKLIAEFIEKNEDDKFHKLSRFRAPWGRMFKKEIIDRYNIKFNEDLCIGEDFLFNMEYLSHAESACLNEGYFYNYINNDNSAMGKYREDCWQNNYQKLINNLKEFLIDNNMYDDVKSKMYRLIIKYYIVCIYNERKAENKNKKLKTIKNLCHDSLIKEAVKYTKINEYKLREKLILIFTRYKLSSFIYILNNI